MGLMSDTATDLSGGQAVCLIMAGLLDDLSASAPGALAGCDIEHLHEYRVALRRMRALVGQFKEIMPAGTAAYLAGELRWLGDCTGALRDADIYLAALERYRGWLPEDLQIHLQPLQQYLRRIKNDEQERFVRALNDKRYNLFAAYVQDILTKGPAAWGKQANAPYADLAAKKIWRLYKKMLGKGCKINPDSPAAALHELRKSGKKLRYLAGFAKTALPGRQAPGLLRRLRRLQAILGDHQDFEVQAETLMRFSKQLMRDETAPHGAFLANGILIGHLASRQAGARANFEACFKKFSSKPIKRECRALMTRPETGKEAML